MESEKVSEDRLVEIETKIAFQENIIKDLSDTVYNQQKQMDTLYETLKHLIDQLRESSIMSAEGNLKSEKPPHY